jgi:aminopeptidase N
MSENNLTRDEAQARARLVADLDYDVALDLTGDDRFRSETRLRFRCPEPGAETFVDLTAVGVEEAILNGKKLPVSAFDGNRLRLPDLAGDNELRVVADVAYENTGVGLHRFVDPVDGQVYLHTQFEPYDAHRVFACFDQPDLKGVFRFSVLAPAGWGVVSGGRASERPEGEGWWRFEVTPRMSTYITALVAGPYHSVTGRHGEIDLGLYCRRSLAEYLDAEEILEITGAGFDFFERVFGQPYPFSKYDQCFVPEFNFGAMENAGCITFSERHLFRSKVTEAEREARADTILHEMAHMWFGDLVTMRWWDDLWLNESFATFASHLALAEATRFRQTWTTFATSMKTWAYRQDQLPTTHPIVADAPDVEAMKTNFDGITYAKGASVLRQLVAWVGQEEFLAGVRTYFGRHAWGNTDLRDFLASLEESSGRELKSWSEQWLETAGVNTLRASFATDDSGAFRSFCVEQEAPPEWPTLRPHRLAVGLYDRQDGRLRQRKSIELDVVGHRTGVDALVGEPAADLVLVNDGDLAYAKIRLDEGSLRTASSALAQLDDPLARALCWAATWDMLRDAELAARRYLAVVLDNLAGEGEISVVTGLLRQAEAAAVVYGDPANREPARRRLAEWAQAAMNGATAGSDEQLAFARAFAAAARGSDHLAVVAGLLDGSATVTGLDVDTELRWHLVRCLAAAGAAGEEAIAAEEDRDPTDAGHRHAAAARASRPDPQAKAAAWRALVEEDLPLATMRAIMGGFRQPDQELLLAPYTKPYFEALGPVWERRGPDVAMSFTELLYPLGDGAVQLTDAHLATAGPPPPVRRLLLEGRDQALRVARARACDSAAG